MQRAFGTQGFPVPALGLGAGHIGSPALNEAQVGTLLGQALDMGVTLIDTAPSYGLSEERIGRHLAHRRADCILSTKVGYGITGHDDWSYGSVAAGIDAALKRLRTDHLDIVHLHSCPLEILQRGNVIRALHDARTQGKLRVAAYSGENAELQWAIASGQFGGVECSVNLFDQRSLEHVLPQAQARGIGVIAKRPLANSPWRFAGQPIGDYCEEYWLRWQAMGIAAHDMDWPELALRFAAHAPAVSCAIVGTASLEHLQQDKRHVERGPLPPQLFESLRQAFRNHDDNWIGQV
ncbi:MAG: aldo/keto reductase [Nitrosomonadales bacterium]|nr:aldo/keto reductase [Nitrosomonadales bacterium]